MGGYFRKNWVLIVLFLIFISFSYLVSADNNDPYFGKNIKVLDSEISNYTLSLKAERWIRDKHVQTLKYVDLNNKTYNIMIWYSNNSKNIDILYSDRLKNSKSKKNYSGYTLNIFNDGKSVFWRRGFYFIEIYSEDNKINKLPHSLILQYLKFNSPTCNGKECYESISLDQEESFFSEPTNLHLNIKKHIGVWYNCPKNLSILNIKNKIGNDNIQNKNLNNADFSSYYTECKSKESFYVKPIPSNDSINDCFIFITNLLSLNNLTSHKKWIYQECYIQENFKSKYNKNNLDNYSLVLSNRQKEFIEFITLKYNNLSQSIEITKNNTVFEKDNLNYESSTKDYERKQPNKNFFKNLNEKLRDFVKWLE